MYSNNDEVKGLTYIIENKLDTCDWLAVVDDLRAEKLAKLDDAIEELDKVSNGDALNILVRVMLREFDLEGLDGLINRVEGETLSRDGSIANYDEDVDDLAEPDWDIDEDEDEERFTFDKEKIIEGLKRETEKG